MHGGAVGLLARDLVNVDDVFFPVDAHDAARVALEVSAGDGHLVLNSKQMEN